MFWRGLAATDRTGGGSALMKKRRPDWSVIAVICACVDLGAASRAAMPMQDNIPPRISRVRELGLGEGIGLYAVPAHLRFPRIHPEGWHNLFSILCLYASIGNSYACEGKVPALPLIIATVPGRRGRSARHFLKPMCLFRQLLPNRVGPRRSPPLALPASVSACRRGP